jgi:hypothetical protein
MLSLIGSLQDIISGTITPLAGEVLWLELTPYEVKWLAG